MSAGAPKVLILFRGSIFSTLRGFSFALSFLSSSFERGRLVQHRYRTIQFQKVVTHHSPSSYWEITVFQALALPQSLRIPENQVHWGLCARPQSLSSSGPSHICSGLLHRSAKGDPALWHHRVSCALFGWSQLGFPLPERSWCEEAAALFSCCSCLLNHPEKKLLNKLSKVSRLLLADTAMCFWVGFDTPLFSSLSCYD